MPQITLPVTKAVVTIRNYVPHGVARRFQQAMFKGLNINFADMKPGIEELAEHFGEETMRKVDSLPEGQRAGRLKQMENEYMQDKMQLEGIALANAMDANTVKVVGMITSIQKENGDFLKMDDLTETYVDDLPEEDFQAVLGEINKLESRPLEQKPSEESMN